ncbi:MAG: hypothetical protein ACRC33_06030, partial [Gemmataceae bacterium]
MARFVVACLLVAGLCTAGMVVLGQSLWDPARDDKPAPGAKAAKPPEGTPPARTPSTEPRPVERSTAAATAADEGKVEIVDVGGARLAAPMTILDARVMSVQQQNVPAQRDGMLLFLGTEIEPGEYVSEEKQLAFEITTLAIRVKDEREWASLSARDQLRATGPDGKVGFYRPVTDTDNLLDTETTLIPRKLTFRTLDVGDHVKPGQMLGVINPVLALAEVRKQQQKVDMSQTEVRAAGGMREESYRRWQRDAELTRKAKSAVSPDELAISKVTYEKYREEEQAKVAGVKMSQAELAATFTVLRQHIVRATIP